MTKSYDLTINQMKKSGKLLLITYNKADMEKGYYPHQSHCDRRRNTSIISFPNTSESNIIWPSWERYSTKDLYTTEIREYMRKVFTKKYKGSPTEPTGWTFFGRQGVESSYVSKKKEVRNSPRCSLIENRTLDKW